MMAKLALNEADKWTDNTLDEIVEHLDSVYRKAYKEMSEERRKSFSAFLKSDKKKLKELNDGQITKEEYKMWRIGWLNSDLRMRTLIDDYAQKITDTNVIASDYINDKTPEIFAYNHNYTAYEFEKGTGISFTIVDKNTVKELATGKNHIEFRTLSVDKKKDYAWNRKKIQQALTSGIVQGKSIPKIAKDFYAVMGSNKKSAVRNARTAVTSAQNGGRQRGFEQAHDNGIKFKKEWLSAHDGRVRDSHAHLDGVKVEYNKKFPNGLMYPADPSGRPEEVYNCRCTLIADVNEMRGKRTNNTASSYEKWLILKKAYFLKKSSGIVSDLRLEIMSEGVKYNQPKYLPFSQRNDKTIINKICVTDDEDRMGSCTSLALAYVGNLMGLDVVDSRQDEVTKMLQNNKYIKKVAELIQNPIIVKTNDDFQAWEMLKTKMVNGGKYVLSIGEHTAIIRKRNNKISYLDLQAGEQSGWRKWSEKTHLRFGFHDDTDYETDVESFLIDCKELENCSEFEILLGYLNKG